MAESKLVAKSIICELANGEKFLIGVIDIDCPICREQHYLIPGHHMRALLRVLAEWVEAHPELTSKDDTLKVLHREHWQGTAPSDPTTN